ncbi:hypothetical protein LWI28_026990 [Acer negundo]|uniref:C2H2-type domain-containing protein n=1 Tax=Acer negundo TaxID=4023 RepID=A0AAD5NFQ7_ACENE|nr:hypothetical protein LWI28_026990 [Acer negundo]
MSKKKGSSTTIEPPLAPPPTLPSTPPTTTVGQPSQPPTPSVEPAEVKEAVQKALDLLRDGEHEKALNLINESISRHPRSARLHFFKGILHLSIATVYDDVTKAKHLEDGIRSAQIVAEIWPNSDHCVILLDDLHKELAVFNKKSESKIESPTDYEIKDLCGEDLSQDSRFDDDMKWLEDVKSPKNLEFVAKKEGSEVMAEDRRTKQSKAIMKKLKDNNENISKYKQYWNITLSDEQKKGFRKVNVEELVNHIMSLNDQLAINLLLEAIDFAKQHKSWAFWECYDCVMKFGDYKSFIRHFWQVHWLDSRSMWKLDEELLIESIDMIVKGVWKPFDTKEAIKLIANPVKSEKGFDKSKSSPVVQVPGTISKRDDKESTKTTMEAPKWAFCDDIERTEILRRIHKILFLLRKTKCLSPSIVGWALEYAKDQFENIIPLSQFKDLGLKRLQVICFLGASQLTEMITFLEDVSHTCGLSENVEMDNSMLDKLSVDDHVFDIKERVLFSRDFTCLHVDERELHGKLNATNCFDEVLAGDGSAVSLSAVDVVSVCDDIVSWLFMESNCGEGLDSWKSLIESRRSQAVKSQNVFLEKLSVIPQTSAKNDEIQSKLRAIQKLENMLLEEIEKEKSPEHESQHYMDLLKKRQTELQVIEDTSKRSELDAISEILEKAQVQSADQSGFEGCSAQDELRMQEGAKHRDNCIKIALKQLKMKLLKQLSCHDVIILRRSIAFRKYVKELTNETVCDYRSIVVPMLKSFLQSHLKDLYEDAERKSKAAEEALLAAMAIEADKDSADVKQNQDKKKKKKMNKKKNKMNKNPETSEESEATDASEHIELHQKDEEQNDNPDCKNDELKQLTVADESRRLDGYLEILRRFENEVSQCQWILKTKNKNDNPDQPSQRLTPSIERVDPEVNKAIQQAIVLLKNGEHQKAMNLINEYISFHPRSGQLRYAKGRMHLSLATTDDDAKAKHLEDGIRSAQLATELLPNSTQCARLLVDLHKELEVFNKESESDRGLATESPTDYGMKDLFGEDLFKESIFDDMKWLADIESPKNLEFDVKKEDIEVMATERRKKQSKAIMKKLKDNNNDISMYKQFWNITLSDEKKRGFRKVNIEELENHFRSIRHQLAVDLLLEAIDFAKQHKSWTFWECYDCVMKFGDYKSFSKHYWLVHWLGSRSTLKIDEELWIESIDMIGKGVWKPFDTNEAIKLIVNPMKSEKGFDECKSSSIEEFPGNISRSDDKESSKTTMDASKWAFCDDIERTEILMRIHRILFLLRKTKCLSPAVVRWALEYAKDQFESIIPLSQFKDLGLKRLQVICFLGASQLTEILTFLEDVSHTCGISENIEMDNSMLNKLCFDHQVFDIKERVLFSRDFTCLLVDERVLRGKLNATNYFDAVAGDGFAVSLSAVECEADVPVCDDIVSWLYMGSSCQEGLESWESLRESRRSQAVKSQTACLEKLSVLPQTSATNDEISSKLRAIQKLENMFLEEIIKEKSQEHELQLYMELLKKRQTELQEIEDTYKRSELDTISEILEKAQEVQSEDESRMQEGAKQRDNCIKIALNQLKMQLLKRVSCHDVINTRKVLAFRQYVQEITNKTVCDYRSIVVPMLKLFLQSHLKDLYKDAKENSKAAEEELLVDMALEADKDSADVTPNQDKKKKKKKNKKKKNKNPETSKESEATDACEHIELHQKDEEQNDNPDCKNDDSLDEPKQSAVADEARRLDGYLEILRQFEHEVSQCRRILKTKKM